MYNASLHRNKWEKDRGAEISKVETQKSQAEMLAKMQEEFSKERAAYDEKIKSGTEETKRLSAEVKIKTKTNGSLRTSVAELSARLDVSTGTNQHLKKQVKDMEEKFGRLCANHHVTSKKQYDTIVEQNNKLASIEIEIKLLLEDPKKSEITSLHLRKNNEVLSLKRQLSVLQEDLLASNRKASLLDMNLTQSAIREKVLQSELTELQSEFEYVKIAADLVGEDSMAEKDRSDKEHQLNMELLTAKEELMQDNSNLNEQLDKFAVSLEEAHARNENMKAESWDLLQENESFREKFDKLEHWLKERDAVKEEFAKMVLGNESLEKDKEVLEEQIDALSDALDERNSTIAAHRSSLEQLLFVKEILDNEMKGIQEQLNQFTRIIDEKDTAIERGEASKNERINTFLESLEGRDATITAQRASLVQLLFVNEILSSEREGVDVQVDKLTRIVNEKDVALEIEKASKKQNLITIEKLIQENEQMMFSGKNLAQDNRILQDHLHKVKQLLEEKYELMENAKASPHVESLDSMYTSLHENESPKDQQKKLEQQLLKEKHEAITLMEVRAHKDRCVAAIRINELEREIASCQTSHDLEKRKLEKEMALDAQVRADSIREAITQLQVKAKEKVELLQLLTSATIMLNDEPVEEERGISDELSTRCTVEDEIKTFECSVNLWDEVELALLEQDIASLLRPLGKMQQFFFEIHEKNIYEAVSNKELGASIEKLKCEREDLLEQFNKLNQLLKEKCAAIETMEHDSAKDCYTSAILTLENEKLQEQLIKLKQLLEEKEEVNAVIDQRVARDHQNGTEDCDTSFVLWQEGDNLKQDLAKLEQILKEKDEVIATMEHRTTQENEHLQSKLNKLEHLLTEKKGEAVAAIEDCYTHSAPSQESENLREELAKLEQLLKEKDEAIAAVEDCYAHSVLSQKSENLQEELEKIDQFLKEKDGMIATIEHRATRENERLQEELSKLKKLLKEKDKVIAAMEQRAARARDQQKINEGCCTSSVLSLESENRQQELAKLEQLLREKDEVIATIEQRATQDQQNSTEGCCTSFVFTQESENLKEELTKLEQLLKEKNAMLAPTSSALTQEIEHLKEVLVKLMQLLKEKDEVIANRKEELTKLEQLLKKKDEMIASMEHRAAKDQYLTARINELQCETANYQIEMDEVREIEKSRIKELECQTANYQIKMDKVREIEKLEIMLKVSALNDTADKLKEEARHVQKKALDQRNLGNLNEKVNKLEQLVHEKDELIATMEQRAAKDSCITRTRINEIERQMTNYQIKMEEILNAEKRQVLRTISVLNDAAELKSKERVKRFQKKAQDQLVILKSTFRKLTVEQIWESEIPQREDVINDEIQDICDGFEVKLAGSLPTSSKIQHI